jgi:hypothetical protein
MLRDNLEIPNLKTWRTIFLLSIIVPVGLLTTFKLAGIFEEPSTIAETITLPAKNWVFQRPYPDEDIDIYQWLNATYSDYDVSFTIALELWEFMHWPLTILPPGDSIDFGLTIDVRTTEANSHIQGMEIIFFCNSTQPSYVWLKETSIKVTNLTVTYLRDRYNLKDPYKTHLTLKRTGNPNEVRLKATNEWFLNDISPDALDHQLRITHEITYYNGTAYKKLVQPFLLTILASEQP